MTYRKPPTSIDDCTDFEREVLEQIPFEGYVGIPAVANAIGRRFQSVSAAIYRLWRGKLIDGLDYDHWQRKA